MQQYEFYSRKMEAKGLDLSFMTLPDSILYKVIYRWFISAAIFYVFLNTLLSNIFMTTKEMASWI